MPPYKMQPSEADTSEELADWVEWKALLPRSRGTSVDDLVRQLKRAGTTGTECDDDRGSEHAQQRAVEAFQVLADRKAWLRDFYPFDLMNRGARLEANECAKRPLYSFLLSLSLEAPTSGHAGTAVLFEDLCTEATRQLVGGPSGPIRSLRFGAPRTRPAPSKFNKAIEWLVTEIQEGEGPHKDLVLNGDHTGDDGLDIVAWRPWRDRRGNQFMIFGQCAAGASDWDKKISELKTAWHMAHFQAPLLLPPLRCVFIPRWIPQRTWRRSAAHDVLVVDRGRIVESAAQLAPKLRRRLNAATTKALKGLR